MPSKLILVAALIAAIVIIAYYFVPEFQPYIASAMSHIDAGWLLLAIAATALHFLSEMGRWWFYLRNRAIAGIALARRLFAIFSVTAFLAYLLPVKLGLPLRLYLLKSQLNLQLPTISSMLLVDGLLCYGQWVLATLALYILLPTAPSLDVRIVYVAAALVLASVGLVVARKRFERLMRWREDILQVSFPGLVAAAALQSVDIAGYIVRHAALLLALGVHIEPGQIAFATVASVTAGLLSMLPMGIGAYDVTLIWLLSGFSVPPEIAVTVPVLNRIANVLVAVVFGLPASYTTGMSMLTLRQRIIGA